jgi:hypothetical protein
LFYSTQILARGQSAPHSHLRDLGGNLEGPVLDMVDPFPHFMLQLLSDYCLSG